MRRLTAMLLVIGWIGGAVSHGAEMRELWRIGERNGRTDDLATLSQIGDYLKTFTADVDFKVGESDPTRHFSALQPGPYDAWAGRRDHPFRIRFDLAEVPDTACELRLDLIDTHAEAPPSLLVRINAQEVEVQLERGTGDPSLTRPELGKARTLRFCCTPDQLVRGENTIELTGRRGSWIIYDAVSFHRGCTDEITLSIEPTIFFVERDGSLGQECHLTIMGASGNQPIQLEFRDGEKLVKSTQLKGVSLGVHRGEIHIPPADRRRELTLTARVGDHSGAISFIQPVQKQWRIYCAPSTHTDIGYTDVQPGVIKLHNRNTDLALELIAEFPDYHWNLESSWAAQMWFRDNPSYRHNELRNAARERRIGIESGYLNMLTGLCSDEELIRNLYYSARLHREQDVPFESFTLTDAPSHVWSLPTILSGAGIRCVSVGVNGIRAPLLDKGKLHDKSPFWWEGPDGSRVLTWFTPGYSQAGSIGLKEGAERMRDAIRTYLYRFQQREDYPCDAILLHGAYSDNVAIGRDIAESITAYNKRYAYPKVVLCANNDFFDYVEANFADQLPVYRGCGGSWWEDGAGSSAQETAITRVAHQDVIAAEKVWASAGGAGRQARYPIGELNRVWDDVLLYDEHTWGAHNSMTEPTSDFVLRQFAIKAAYATDASALANRLLASGLQRLAGRVKAPDGSLLVFNPSGRTRTGIVEARIPRGSAVMSDKGILPQQVIESGALDKVTVALRVEDVPAMGYNTYPVGPQAGNLPGASARVSDNVMENTYYRVTFDKATGGIASIVDRESGRELVDQESDYTLGQAVYAADGGFADHYIWWGPNPDAIKWHKSKGEHLYSDASGPVFTNVKSRQKLAATCSIAGRPDQVEEVFHVVELETILYEHEKRIDFAMRVHKRMTYDREALYIAFPFAGANPRFRYEIGGGSVRPNEDHLPGGCRDWFAVQRWVTVETDQGAVAWSPVDTPLITLCDMTPGKWLDELPITNGTVFAYALNNYWFTNYKAGQDGWFTFRYSLTSDGAIAPDEATHFGESTVQSMRTAVLHAGRRNPNWPVSRSLCRVEPETVELTACKPADDGNGLIIRVRETAGRDTDVTVRTAFPGMTKASRCDLVERIQGPIDMADGGIRLKVKANGWATLRLE